MPRALPTRTERTDLSLIVRAEYAELPGMRLTLRQAARLWNVEPDECARVLQSLVAAGYLRRTGTLYVRADTGPRRF